MKRIINIVIDFSKTHKKPLVIFTSALISLGVICGVFIYNNGVQNKKEKELLSRIDNLEEQINKEEELSEKDKSDINSADSPNKEIETDSTGINSTEEVETQNNNTTTNQKEEATKNSNENISTGAGSNENVSGSAGGSGIIESNELVVLSSNGIKGINYKRFGECLTVVSLTIDNWRDYIDVITYNTWREFGIKTNKYHYIEKGRLKLKHIETQETIDYSFPATSDRWGGGLSEDFNLDDYECIEIKGKIYFVDFPSGVIHTPLPEWDYACGFMIIGSGSEAPYEISPQIKRIYPNGVEDWEAKYMK